MRPLLSSSQCRRSADTISNRLLVEPTQQALFNMPLAARDTRRQGLFSWALAPGRSATVLEIPGAETACLPDAGNGRQRSSRRTDQSGGHLHAAPHNT
jgi:hypothetical protein